MKTHLLAIQKENDTVGDVRGLGPMLIIEFVKDKTAKTPMATEDILKVTGEALKRGLIVLRAGLYTNCIRLLPPLNMTDEQVDEGMKVLAEAVRVAMPKREVVAGD
jgi:4-aminobutyrate aminotransferase / (S)-3-amino-2-methylpropionate transaminase / 5-aminovalerate transaminase